MLTDEVGLERLIAFKRAKGHCLVPPFGPSRELNVWVEKQRELWREAALPPKLERKLRALDFPFDESAMLWERQFAQAAKRARRYKRLPPENTPLGKWVRGQLTLAELGALEPERAARLKSLPSR
ncbi:MAG: helicase associated domain-containing protein [Myxococcaceae bacterium]|nr:helicase associated domain-containing protein [Myxococcaceae bacterium]